MQTFTIQQLNDMISMPIPKDGLPIDRVEARIINVYPASSGVHAKYGPWTLQNGFIEDSTGRMKVVFSTMSDQAELAGQQRIFRSTESPKGVNGLKLKKSEYQGKTTLELWVTKTAMILEPDDQDPNVEKVSDSPRPPATTPKELVPAGFKTVKAPLTPKDVSHDDRKLDIMKAKNRLTQLAGLYDLCWKTVEGMELMRDPIEIAELKDIATTLFIQSTKEGLIDCMPIRTLSKFYNEEAIKPANPKSPEMPMYPEDEGESEQPF